MHGLIGVISDTHGLLRDEAIAALRGSDLILHAGDIGHASVIERLNAVAPTIAVRGNVDSGVWAQRYPLTNVATFEEHYVYLLHNFAELDLDPATAGFAAVVSGHSHQPNITMQNGVLYLNPGSAGPRRFSLPISVAKIFVAESGLRSEIIDLSV
ncbi:MAG: metallophosphoesterase family protein [Gammaproteobacteria bacterium]